MPLTFKPMTHYDFEPEHHAYKPKFTVLDLQDVLHVLCGRHRMRGKRLDKLVIYEATETIFEVVRDDTRQIIGHVYARCVTIVDET